MRRAGKVFWPVIFAIVVAALSGISAFGGTKAQTVNLPETVSSIAVDDDYVPEVTARVARISFVKGDAKIRRSGIEEWENVTLNLPITEGDEIVTEANGRIEVQFDKHKHLRLAESSYLKIVNLKDEGIATSLSIGTLNLHISSFDKDRSYFEIDAPKTTIAIQKAGTYRIDAGKEGDHEVRVAATDGGEARVYSDNAGFTLKNGRSAKIFIEGINAGEWETAKAERYIDEFDEWSADRDSVIAKRLKDAYYDKYYDNDIYGADDLNDHGNWVHTQNYGYVWRPYRTSLSRYADWSPYRYGHWRWMPPYGWIWVNDEPWGWATYHHGRWFYDAGYWNWSPYGYYRHSRSWWFPALVVINIFNNNVCWYPLPYHYANYNYNVHYNTYNNNVIYPTGGIKPIPTGTPVQNPTGGIKPWMQTPPGTGGIKAIPGRGNPMVPANAVVATTKEEFGTIIRGTRKLPLSVANAVLSQTPDTIKAAPALPAYADVTRKISRGIRTAEPHIAAADVQIKTGATARKSSAPLDNELRVNKVFGGRPPLTNNLETGGIRTIPAVSPEPRKTGAIERPPVVKQNNERTPIRQTPVYSPPAKTRVEPQNEPVRTPRYDPPPTKQPAPTYNPPPVKQSPPSYSPPPKQESPPVRQPPRSDPPPTKSEPKPYSKPSSPPDTVVVRKKDGGEM